MELRTSKPLTLKCGLALPNRLVKAAMAEGFADSHHLPASQTCLNVYRQWAQGGWGLVITGNVQVDAANLGEPGDIAVDTSLPEARSLAAFQAWAATCSSHGTKAVVQLCHPGRQIAFKKDKMAPSAIPMDFGDALVPRLLNSLVFGTPRAMTVHEIQTVISQFTNAARLMAAAGFAGIQLHAAHGYLLAQFLSARSNGRTDAYGGSAVARARIVVEIIHAVRDVVPPGFCVGLKLNSVDVGQAADLGDCLEQVRAIAATAGIDFLEVSGGTFEDPVFSTGPRPEALPQEQQQQKKEKKKQSTMTREAFFLDFAKAIRETVANIPLVVTGGFRTRKGMEAALTDGSCDLIGLARPAIMDPLFPRTVLLNPGIPTDKASISVKRIPPSPVMKMLGVKLLGVGAERTLTGLLQDWYTRRMHRISQWKGSIVVLGASDAVGRGFIHELLHRPDAARDYCGVYCVETTDDDGTISQLLMRAEEVQHKCELIHLRRSDLAGARKVAETINRRVALGLLPPVVSLVLCPDAGSQITKPRHIRTDGTMSGNSANKKSLSQFLLCLLLLQSMDKESGRIVFISAADKSQGGRTGCLHASFGHGDSESKSLLHSHQSMEDLNQSYTAQQLSARLSTDPELSGLSVVGIEPQFNGKGIVDRITRWLVVAVTALLLLPRLGARSWDTAKHKPTAQETLRVVLDYANGIYVGAAAIQESGADSCAEIGRLWQDNVVAAGIKDGDTLLANWR